MSDRNEFVNSCQHELPDDLISIAHVDLARIEVI